MCGEQCSVTSGDKGSLRMCGGVFSHHRRQGQSAHVRESSVCSLPGKVTALDGRGKVSPLVVFIFRPSQTPPQTLNLHLPLPPHPPSTRRRREPGNVCTGFCSAAEHHSLFSKHHLCSHVPEVRSVHLLSCQTQPVLDLETSSECAK
ncbi:hypothetical protein NDU88_008284 [Pleurodeles waltl]|uniref:Uncharacterized protein n=1 Tax=Pleurodeles waltl TaxID=8319 RepID=A0AAV7SUT2_PLEWA|nr:hypothetical protein NDU88_008284 [Pleurodeles waltl]